MFSLSLVTFNNFIASKRVQLVISIHQIPFNLLSYKKHENDLHEFAFGTIAMCAIDALEIFTMGMALCRER